MKIEKRSYGYIKKKTLYQFVWTLGYVLIGIIIFVVGFILNHGSKTNIFTVLAILMVLPAAKRLVSVVVFLPFRSVSKDEVDDVKAMVGKNATVYTDYVFTSPDKIMFLSFLVVEQGNVLGVLGNEKQKIEYIGTYLRKGVCNYGRNYNVRIVKTVEELEREYKKITPKEEAKEKEEAVLSYLKTLAV